ncbi:hypothetical protein JCM10450v2_007751 [Rhodotorula kratochvilovae]
MATGWTYSTTCRGAQPPAPSLALAASSPSPSSLDTLLATTTLCLNLRVAADDEDLDPDQLMGSGILREVRAWLDKNKTTIGVDNIGESYTTADSVTIPLHAFSRCTRASALSLPPALAPAAADGDADAAPPAGLAEIDLTLRFRSSGGSRPRKRARCAAPISPSQSKSQSQHESQPAVPGITLVSQLLSPAALHFTLAALLEAALARFAKKLRSIAGSLCGILGLDGGGGGDSSSGAQGLNEEVGVREKAAALSQRLTAHLSALYPSLRPAAPPFPPASPPSPRAYSPPCADIDPALFDARSPPAVPSAKRESAQPALETALLLLSTRGSAPDPWVAAAAAGEGGDECGRMGKGKGRKKAGKPAAAKGGGRGRKARVAEGEGEERLLEDDGEDESGPLGASSASLSTQRASARDCSAVDSPSPGALAFSDAEDGGTLGGGGFSDWAEGAADEMDWFAD